MEALIKDLKRGDLFTLVDCSLLEDVPESKIYVRGDYERTSKKYSCIRYTNACSERFFSGTKKVYVL